MEKRGTKKFTTINSNIDLLDVNQFIIVKNAEYRKISPFSTYIQASFCKQRTNKKFKVTKLLDGIGWKVLRIR